MQIPDLNSLFRRTIDALPADHELVSELEGANYDIGDMMTDALMLSQERHEKSMQVMGVTAGIAVAVLPVLIPRWPSGLEQDFTLKFIKAVYDTLFTSTEQAMDNVETASTGPLTPAVPISESVTPDHIFCLEDGKKFRSLKRHIMSKYGLTPDDYRAKWGLPSDYPMTAANYSANRSALAKKSGLGKKKV